VIELGAGTGALSRRLSELRPVLVEQDTDWAGLLQQKFPSLDVRAECATRTLEALDHPCGLVLSIPLLNNPQAETLRALIEERRAEGWVRFCVLYTYGGRDPLSGAGFRRRERAAFVVRNLPPAWVWAYS
jgi:phosphatidylethanolamine/phosphatidyl-N-methylethanolamine N-methyltransferase